MIFKHDSNNTIFDYKEDIGVAFFILGIIMLFYMIFSPLNNVFFNPDEFFTFGMIKYSFLEILTATAVDTHPPGYYFILKVFISALNIFNINFNPIIVTKLVSILPYALILLVSFTKLKKEYGWFTSGVFVFAIGLMSGFYFQFLTIRMYNWGLFFLLMSFIYFKDIINNSSIKSWVLFSLFSALVLYTHYFIAFPLALIYLSLLVYLICFCQDNYKEERKKFIGSIVLTILFYLPWIPYFITQMRRERAPHNIPPIDLNTILSSCIYYLTGNDFFMIKILAIIFTIFLIILAFKKYDFEPTAENYYIITGFFIFFGTIFISIIISIIKEPILLPRYLIPSASIILLSISILIGKINNKKLFIISLIFLLIFGVTGLADINSQTPHLYETGINCEKMFDEMNNDLNAIVIYDGGVGVFEYETFLDNLKSYSPPTPTIWGVNNTTAHNLYNFEEKSPNELESIIKNSNNKIYFVDAWGNVDVNDTYLTQFGQIAGAKFYYIDGKDANAKVYYTN